mgnify:CR=1 FL=1
MRAIKILAIFISLIIKIQSVFEAILESRRALGRLLSKGFTRQVEILS